MLVIFFMNLNKNLNYIILINILFILLPIFFFEGPVKNGHDLYFGFLTFYNKFFLADPFNNNLIITNRVATSLLGSLFHIFLDIPENFTFLYLYFNLFSFLPLVCLAIYVFVQKESFVKFSFIISLVIFFVFIKVNVYYDIIKYTALIFFIHFTHINFFKKRQKKYLVKIIIPLVTVILYPIYIIPIFLISNYLNYKNKLIISNIILLPCILYSILIYYFNIDGKDTYILYDALAGRYDLYVILWYFKQQLVNFEIDIALFIFIIGMNLILINLINKNIINRFNFLVTKKNIFVFLILFFLCFVTPFIRQNFLTIPSWQFSKFVFLPFAIILFFLLTQKFITYLLINNILKNLLIFIFIISLPIQNYKIIKNSSLENSVIGEYNAGKKIEILPKNFSNKISEIKLLKKNDYLKICELKLSYSDIFLIKIWGEFEEVRPFNITFQNPYSKLKLPRVRQEEKKYILSEIKDCFIYK